MTRARAEHWCVAVVPVNEGVSGGDGGSRFTVGNMGKKHINKQARDVEHARDRPSTS